MSGKDKKKLDTTPSPEEHDALNELEDLDEDMDVMSETSGESGEAKAAAKPAKQQAKTAAKAKQTKTPEKKRSGNRLVRFFKDMRSELKKVSWPSGKQTVNNTGIVIGVVLVAGAFVWIFDGIMGNVIGALLKLFGA